MNYIYHCNKAKKLLWLFICSDGTADISYCKCRPILFLRFIITVGLWSKRKRPSYKFDGLSYALFKAFSFLLITNCTEETQLNIITCSL